MSQKIRCANADCRRFFSPNPRVKNQQYCNKEQCQRVRKNRWQRQKMKNNPQYRKDQKEGQQCWIEQNQDYWQQYRDQHPECVIRNRFLQKERDQKRRSKNLAKMDSLKPISPVKAGRYYIIPGTADLAKMDSLSHTYRLIPIS